MDTILNLLQYQVEKPGLFSLFHFIVIILIVLPTIFVAKKYKDCSEKTYKKIILICLLICTIFEIIKQFVKSYHYGNPSYFEYSFYDLPFHLCSTIYYICPILLFIKREKTPFLYDSLTWFMGIFSLAAGIGVVIYNDIVMSTLLFTNIQSMIHHGMQVLLGVFIVTYNRKQLNINSFLRSLVTLTIYAMLAFIINIIIAPISNGIDMFYINPYEVSAIPVINEIHRNVGFIPYLIVYLSLVLLIAFITYSIEVLIINKFDFKCIFKKEELNEKREDI